MPIRIHKTDIDPGQRVSLGIPAGRLPTGRQLLVRVEVIRAQQEGPRVLVMGGMHGDEVNGVEIVRRILASDWLEALQAGTVIGIPLLNVYGFLNKRREVPGGKDINRSFPGSRRGTLASRLASILSRKILPCIDWGIDFHSGAGQTYNYPHVRYTPGDQRAAELARGFAAPFHLPSPAVARSMRKTFGRAEKPILVFEGGENLRLDAFSIDRALDGFRQLLSGEGMIPPFSSAREPSVSLGESSWLRAPASGLFQGSKASGQAVVAGEPLGAIHSPFGKEKVVVKARKSGFIIGHSNAGLVNQGDALFHLAQPAGGQ